MYWHPWLPGLWPSPYMFAECRTTGRDTSCFVIFFTRALRNTSSNSANQNWVRVFTGLILAMPFIAWCSPTCSAHSNLCAAMNFYSFAMTLFPQDKLCGGNIAELLLHPGERFAMPARSFFHWSRCIVSGNCKKIAVTCIRSCSVLNLRQSCKAMSLAVHCWWWSDTTIWGSKIFLARL